ncbi:MAG: nucleotidyltransferase family protein [Burkholderiaceae bacterium]|nr:nucleotidyltransferase family protein [Burkholderiaceae bacterium]
MLLAAGRGERMRPLTDTRPKPLLEVQGKPLLQWHLEALERAGVHDVVINTAWLGEQIPARFGARWPGGDVRPLAIRYSEEGRDFGHALETAGGIVRALPLLGDVFWVAAGDVFMPGFAFPPEAVQRFAASGRLAHLWLVPNPAHNLRGDFGLSPEGLALNTPDGPRHTYSTVGLYRAAFFDEAHTGIAPGNPRGIAAPLAPLLRSAMDNGQVSAELYTGPWTDVGTPERLAQLNTQPDPA